MCCHVCVCVTAEIEDTQKSGNVKKKGARGGGENEKKRKKEYTTTHLSAKPTSSSDSSDDGNNSTGLSCCGLAFLLLRFFNVGMLYSPSCIVKEYHVLIHILKIKILEHLKYTLYWRLIRTSFRWHTQKPPQKKKGPWRKSNIKIYTNFAHTTHQITEFIVQHLHNLSALHIVPSYMTTHHFVTWKQVTPV